MLVVGGWVGTGAGVGSGVGAGVGVGEGAGEGVGVGKGVGVGVGTGQSRGSIAHGSGIGIPPPAQLERASKNKTVSLLIHSPFASRVRLRLLP